MSFKTQKKVKACSANVMVHMYQNA